MDETMRAAIEQYIKENLTVSVSAGEDWSSFSSGNSIRVNVQLNLNGEIISEDSESFSLPRNSGSDY